MALPLPKCAPRRSIAELPHLVREWDLERNGVEAHLFGTGSNVKAHWICEAGHRWQARISARALDGQGCRACSNERRRGPKNVLSEVNPKLAAEWMNAKNGRPASMVGTGDHTPAWWKCSTCGHEWLARPAQRHSVGHGCPRCNRRGRPITPISTHPLMAEWDHERNRTEGFDPGQIGRGSSLKVWWKCECGHNWKARVSGRVAGKGCPKCASKKRPTKCFADHPLAVEWDHERNATKPSGHRWRDPARVWWICPACHGSYEETIKARVGGGVGCPICAASGWTEKAMVMWLNNLQSRPGTLDEWQTTFAKAGIDHSSGVARRLADALLSGTLASTDLFQWATGDITPAVKRVLEASETTAQRRTYIPAGLRQAVFKRDGHACLACGSTEDLACDHIIPESRGGETEPENLQTLCIVCNSIKLMATDMTLEQIAVRRAELKWLASFGAPDRCHQTTTEGTRCVRAARPGEAYCGIHLEKPTVEPFDPEKVSPPRRPPKYAIADWRQEAARDREDARRHCWMCGTELNRMTKHACGPCRSEWKRIKLSVMEGMWADGWTLAEIADGIGTSRQTAMNQIRVARKQNPEAFPLREPSKRPRTRKGAPLTVSSAADPPPATHPLTRGLSLAAGSASIRDHGSSRFEDRPLSGFQAGVAHPAASSAGGAGAGGVRGDRSSW